MSDVRQALRDSWPYEGSCPDCGRSRSHTIECSLASHAYRMELLRGLRERMGWYEERAKGFVREVLFWQGRHSMLRQENNKLRRANGRLRDELDAISRSSDRFGPADSSNVEQYDCGCSGTAGNRCPMHDQP